MSSSLNAGQSTETIRIQDLPPETLERLSREGIAPDLYVDVANNRFTPEAGKITTYAPDPERSGE